MRFKIDENLPNEVAEVFRAANYDAMSVVEQDLGGAVDADVSAICRREERCLVTLDVGFADITAYPPEQYFGIIVIRLARQDRERILATIPRLFALFPVEDVVGQLWVVDDSRVRIRPGRSGL